MELFLLLILIILLLVFLSMIWPPDSPWAPWWRTNMKIARAMCKLARVKSTDVIYDLGSGDGTALITAAKEFGAKGVGIEIDPVRAYIAKSRNKVEGVENKIKIKKSNFFDEPIDKATVVFVYLVPKALHRLKPKLESELRPGVRIVSYRYKIKYLPLVKEDRIHQLYLYKITKDFIRLPS